MLGNLLHAPRIASAIAGVLAVLALGSTAVAQPAEDASDGSPTPVKALLICGGCCHDYDAQKELIKQGLEAQAHIDVTVVHQGGSGTSAEIELYRDPQWADGYDVILHDECFADDRDPAWLARILAPHRAGKPAVMIHCAMHSYRTGGDEWFELCGVTSHGHGPHYPHEVRNVLATHEIMEGFGPAWFNPAGELYAIEKVWDTATPLATAKDRQSGKDQVCVWTNDYHGTRVFGTTLGHHNETVEDPTFMRLLARGTLWAAGRLEPHYLKPQQPRMEPVNLALEKAVETSSEQTNQNNLSAMAVDGKTSTRWCASDGSFPQWVQVDLGSVQPIQGVRIQWESDDASYVYRVEGSEDGSEYQTLFRTGRRGIQGRAADHPLDGARVRFVRVHCEGASPGSWASIREIKIHGDEMREVLPTSAGAQEHADLLGECDVPAGFEATVFAAPPAVNYPVFVAAAPDGTLFVSSDKNGSLDREPLRGSVIRLRDLDGDGHADESNLYVANVDSPRGLVWDQDRLYLLHPPHLSAFIDEDGDGVSDRQEILVRDIAFGFADRPADHTSNGVTMGIDGWLYLAIGDFGFMNAVGADGRTLQLRGGGVVRVRPDGTGMELYSRGTRNILEVAVDPLLGGYARDNTNDGGGWDVRMHHFTGLEDHGYPRRYIHFADEIVPPIADYGGGSGCGALYLAEPGMPAGFEDRIYTADWGRQQIFRHQVTPRGATVDVDQEAFLGIERATDLDVDARSNIYAASWKGATFTYAGEDVGFVLRLAPAGYQAPELPDFASLSDAELVNLLRDASHRRRLEAQRVLVRRGAEDAERGRDIAARFADVAADRDAPLATRVAALFGIPQIQGADATETLVSLADDTTIAAWAIRALGDGIGRSEQTAAVVPVVLAGLASDDPRTNLESLVAAARMGNGDADVADSLIPAVDDFLGHEDRVLSHTAVEAMVRLGGWRRALEIVGDTGSSEAQRRDATFVLYGSHSLDAVDALIAALAERLEPSERASITAALSRLYHVEGEWQGTSWGTRPDTRGPYYQPEAWEATERIAAALVAELATADAEGATDLLRTMAANRISIEEHISAWMDKVSWGQVPLEERLATLARAASIPGEALERLIAMVGQGDIDADQLAAVNQIFLDARGDRERALRGLLATLERAAEASPTVLRQVWEQDLRHGRLRGHLEAVQSLVQGESLEDEAEHPRPQAALLLAAIASQPDRVNDADVIAAVDLLWIDEAATIELLAQLRRMEAEAAEPLVRRALVDSRSGVEGLAREIADQWGLANLDQWTGPKIAELNAEDALRQTIAAEGDAQRGLQVFTLLGCAKCHDVTPTETLRGPYLPNVAKTYKRDQLAEAILMPSKSIAQGFVQNVFLMEDGRVIAGFVTTEGAEVIEVRDANGQAVRIDVEAIEARRESEVSLMPEGLADTIPVTALADLVTYLESLGESP